MQIVGLIIHISFFIFSAQWLNALSCIFLLQARESFKKLVVSQRPVPEVENLVSENYELENHSVSILELSASDLAEKNNWIGINKVAA